ncbi:MAG TPA: hypothetical protein VF116_14295 [Ktedonobacterales bacterium]
MMHPASPRSHPRFGSYPGARPPFASQPWPSLLPDADDRDGAFLLDDDEPDFILEDDGTVLEVQARARGPGLSARQKLRRSTLAVAVVVIAAVILLGGPGPTAALLNPLPGSAQARALPRILDRSQAWSSADAPAAAGDNPRVRITPVSGPTQMAYACWVDVPRQQLDLVPGALGLASFDVAQQQWHALAPPAVVAIRCDLVADATNPQAALLIVWDTSVNDTTCALPDLYATRDSGASWARVPWSPDAVPNCDLTFRLVAGHLYVFSSEPLLAPAILPPRTAGTIVVTADLGRTWHAADTGLAGLTAIDVVAFRPGGHILAQGEQQLPTTSDSLWQTGDGGASWQYLGRLPGTAPRVYASSNPLQTANGWGPLYLTSRSPLGPYGPSGVLYFAAAQVPAAPLLTLPGALTPPLRWVSLPPPPVSDALSGRPFGATLGDAAQGPDGTFLYLQPVTNTTPYIIVPQYHLWVWHPTAQVWTQAHYSIPPNATPQGVSWGGARLSVMSVWLTTYGGGLTAHVKVQMNSLATTA